MLKQALGLVLVLTASAVVAGCDPIGPGAAGTVSLGPGVDSTGATSLKIYAVPALTRELSLSEPVPTTDSCKRGIARSFPIESVTFPFVYELDCGIGISESRDWRVVAFLHRDTAQADAIAGGEWFGTSDFAVDDCGLLTGGYCGITQDIDVVIDDQAP